MLNEQLCVDYQRLSSYNVIEIFYRMPFFIVRKVGHLIFRQIRKLIILSTNMFDIGDVTLWCDT